MPHDPEPTPPNHAGPNPNAPKPEPARPGPADDDEVPFGELDASELDLASLSSISGVRIVRPSDPELSLGSESGTVPPVVEGEPSWEVVEPGTVPPVVDEIPPLPADEADGGISFDLPDVPDAHAENEDRTMGVSLSQLAELLGHQPAPDSGPASGPLPVPEPPVPVVPVADAEAGDEVPFGELDAGDADLAGLSSISGVRLAQSAEHPVLPSAPVRFEGDPDATTEAPPFVAPEVQPKLSVEQVAPVEDVPVAEAFPALEPEPVAGEGAASIESFGDFAPAAPTAETSAVDLGGDEELPLAEAASATGLSGIPFATESASGAGLSNLPFGTESASEAGLGSMPPAAEASASSLFGSGAPLATEYASDVLHAVPTPAGESGSNLFGSDAPLAELASGELMPRAEPVASDAGEPASAAVEPPAAAGGPGGSSVHVDNLEALEPVAPASGWLDPTPVAPASGWLDSTPDEPAAPAAAVKSGDTSSVRPGEPEVVAEAVPVPESESSDIFQSAPPAASADPSDVIVATALGKAQPLTPLTPTHMPPPAPPLGSFASDVALTFDQPPGGSTIQDAAASGDLPVADDVADADPVFGPDSGPLDSARLAGTPDLPGQSAAWPLQATDFDIPEIDAGTASSILADLVEPTRPETDSSAIHLENPGVDATLSDEPVPPELAGAPLLDITEEASALDWKLPGDSDVGTKKPSSDFDLTPDATDVFAADLGGEPPALADEGRSSIFTDVPAAGEASSDILNATDLTDLSGGSAVVEPTSAADAVEFSDHPNPAAADSATLHPAGGTSAGAVDFDRPETPARPDTTARVPEEELSAAASDEELAGLLDPTNPDAPALKDDEGDEGVVDFGAAHGDPDATLGLGAHGVPAAGPASGILSSGLSGSLSWSRLPRPEEPDFSESTDNMSLDDDAFRGAVSAGLAAPGAAGSKAETTPPPAKNVDDPSVVVDWVAGSADDVTISPPPESGVAVLVEPEAKEEKPAKAPKRAKPAPRREPTPAPAAERSDATDPTRVRPAVGDGKVNRRAGAGMLLGLILGGGIASGVYYSGVLPSNGDKSGSPVANNNQPPAATNPNSVQPPPVAALTAADAQTALNAGDPARAVQVFEKAGAATPQAKAALGQARLFARLRELAQTNAAVAPDDESLTKARADLEAVVNDPDAGKSPAGERAAVASALHLGLTYELAGDRARARAVYADGIKKFTSAADVFQAALDRLDATEPAPAGGTSLRLTPADAERLAVAVAFLFVQDDAPAPAAEPGEAGPAFWKAVNLAAAGNYAEAIKRIEEAKAVHQKRAKALAGRGLNPLTDPLEQIFPRCCDDLKAYWDLRRTLYENPVVGAIAKKDGPAKAFDRVITLKAERDILDTDLKKAKADKDTAEKTLKAEAARVTALEKDVKAEKEAAIKLGKDIKAGQEAVLKLEKSLTAEKEAVVKLEKGLTAAKEMVTGLETKLQKTEAALAAAEKGRQSADATLAAVAKELQAGKLLPEKYDAAALLAASRSAVSRATGPDLTKLVPPELSAVAGTGLTTGHLLDLAARVNKSEATARTATAELAKATTAYQAEITKLKADRDETEKTLKADREKAEKALKATHAAELKTLTDAHATATKKLTDAQAAELKKLTETNTAATDKLKTDHEAAVKKLTDQYAVDAKKLAAEHAAEVKKLNDRYTTDTKKLAADSAAELKKVADASAAKVKVLEEAKAAAEQQFRADLKNALSPTEALDLWLPLLVELRRPSDADGAIAAADKVLKTAAPGSEYEAKALTVSGLAHLLKGEAELAKEQLTAAKRSAAFAEGKPWAKAAAVGLATAADPAAPSRVAVDATPRKDPAAAARFLNAGIVAYRAGRYADAEKALAEAAWHDPADAVAWYFLGAARWAAGKTDQARDDFRQGAEREATRAVPARVIDTAVAPIQGPARDALTAARP